MTLLGGIKGGGGGGRRRGISDKARDATGLCVFSLVDCIPCLHLFFPRDMPINQHALGDRMFEDDDKRGVNSQAYTSKRVRDIE